MSAALIQTIQSLLLDFQEASLATGVPRRLDIKTVPGKASVCIGVRRCGKSTYMYQMVEKLCSDGIPRENVLFLNFFDDRLHGLRQAGPGLITEAYFGLFPEKKDRETVHCFFDEIQAVRGWEPFVDRLMRTEKCQVYLTGSSANLLSREIATQMRGRALSWELFPFSFREFLDHEGIRIDGPISTRKRLIVQKTFDQYWEKGGFPEVAALDRTLRIKVHQEYHQAILFRDIVERHDVSHPRAVSDLAHWLLDNTASLYSVNRLTGYLKSLGHRVPKSTVSDLMSWFEDAYFMFTVRIFDPSVVRSRVNPKKVYCVDHGLVRSVASGLLVNDGHLLENLVFVALRRIYSGIYYHRTAGGREVDFVIPSTGRSPLLVQVCHSLADARTRSRELLALQEGMTELSTRNAKLVTRDETGQVEVEAGTVEIVPVWRFLLDLEDGRPTCQSK